MYKILEDSKDFERMSDGSFKYSKSALKPVYVLVGENNICLNHSQDDCASSFVLRDNVDIIGIRTVCSVIGKYSNVSKLQKFNKFSNLRDDFENKSDSNNEFYNVLRSRWLEREFQIDIDTYNESLMLLSALNFDDLNIIKPHVDRGVEEIIEHIFHKPISHLTNDDVSKLHIDKLYNQARMDIEEETIPEHKKIDHAIDGVKHKILGIIHHMDMGKNHKPALKHLRGLHR